MNKLPLILVGGGGHCRSCIDVIELEGKYSIEGILDEPEKTGQSILNYKVIGSDDDIGEFISKGYSFLVTVGQIKSAEIRKKIFERLRAGHAKIATVISPKAHVSKYAMIGTGTIVMHGVTINAGAIIGVNCILNTGCNIEHDAETGNNCHVSTHAVVNGDCKVGDDVFIGSNSVLVQAVRVSTGVTIGAGAVVSKNISEQGIYGGAPAKKIK